MFFFQIANCSLQTAYGCAPCTSWCSLRERVGVGEYIHRPCTAVATACICRRHADGYYIMQLRGDAIEARQPTPSVSCKGVKAATLPEA